MLGTTATSGPRSRSMAATPTTPTSTWVAAPAQRTTTVAATAIPSDVCFVSASHLVFRFFSSDANEGSGSLRMALYVFGREKLGRAERAIKTDFTSMRRMI